MGKILRKHAVEHVIKGKTRKYIMNLKLITCLWNSKKTSKLVNFVGNHVCIKTTQINLRKPKTCKTRKEMEWEVAWLEKGSLWANAHAQSWDGVVTSMMPNEGNLGWWSGCHAWMGMKMVSTKRGDQREEIGRVRFRDDDGLVGLQERQWGKERVVPGGWD